MNKTIVSLLSVSFLAAGASSARAAFSPPASYLPMTMLNVSIDGSKNLHVQAESDLLGVGKYAVLAWDTLSNGRPNNSATVHGSFDPSAKWHVLNDGAFSRRLGWDSNGSDFYANNTLPIGESVWIQQTDASSKVKTYQVSSAAGNDTGTGGQDSYAQIFGASSPNLWKWDGYMDHNLNVVNTADITQANQLFTATYSLYVGNSITGVRDTSYGAATTTWTWQGPATLVPEPTLSSFVGMFALLFARRHRAADRRYPGYV